MSHVNTRYEAGTAFVEFSVPPVNALPSDVLQALAGHLEAAGRNERVRMIVLASEGRTFCAGASFDELLRLDNMDDAVRFFSGFGKVILAMRSAPKPVVVRVHGKAVGGGVGLVAAGDLSLAVEDVAFKLSELSIGIGAYVISPAIERRTGRAGLQRMSWQAKRWFSAFDALKMGLVDDVFESTRRMDEQIAMLGDRFARFDPLAVARWKQRLWDDTAGWEERMNRLARQSAELLLREDVKKRLNELKG